MVNSFIAKKDLDSEMTVVRNEYEMGENDPTRVMLKRMQSVMYDWHNYGNSTIGARSDIENVRIENLQAFYRMYYQPDNAVLTIAGKFDEKKVLSWVAQAFGKMPRPKRALPALWTAEPTHDGERTVARAAQGRGADRRGRLPAAVGAASGLHGGGPGRRHSRRHAERDGCTRRSSCRARRRRCSRSRSTRRDPGFVLFGAVVKKGEPIEPVAQTLIETIEGTFAKTPPTEEELQRQVQQQTHRVRARTRRSAGVRCRPFGVHRAR